MVLAVHRGTVDGVPVLWSGEGRGRFSVGLVFRVGRADETLATSGLTHLLELWRYGPAGFGLASYAEMATGRTRVALRAAFTAVDRS